MVEFDEKAAEAAVKKKQEEMQGARIEVEKVKQQELLDLQHKVSDLFHLYQSRVAENNYENFEKLYASVPKYDGEDNQIFWKIYDFELRGHMSYRLWVDKDSIRLLYKDDVQIDEIVYFPATTKMYTKHSINGYGFDYSPLKEKKSTAQNIFLKQITITESQHKEHYM